MTKQEALIMLYRACCLVPEGDNRPDWISIIAGTNIELPEMLEKAAEIAINDDTYADVVWADGL